MKTTYQKMNPAVKAKWVAALRGGKYPKTKGMMCRKAGALLPSLRQPEFDGSRPGFCCLGVLREECLLSGGTDPFELTHDELVEAGLTLGVANHLVYMNDYGRRGFGYIADWIEKNL